MRLGAGAVARFAPASLAAFAAGQGRRPPRLEVRFLGPARPERPAAAASHRVCARAHAARGDATFARFLDIFHHRFLAMFYRAWAQAQPTVSLDRPREDRFAAYVGSLIGHRHCRAARARCGARPCQAVLLGAACARSARNADGLVALLAGFFRVPVRIEQFVGHWLTLAASGAARGSGGGCRRAARRAARCSARGCGTGSTSSGSGSGRSRSTQYEMFLPGGSALEKLVAWVRQYLGFELDWDLRLAAVRGRGAATRLGAYGRLGWTTWLGRYLRRERGATI